MTEPPPKIMTEPPPLGGSYRDAGVALVKGAVGTIPLAGGEVIERIIPQQRFTRLEVYVRYLNDRLATLSVVMAPTMPAVCGCVA